LSNTSRTDWITKYYEIYRKWDLKEDRVKGIIEKYINRLIEELISDEPWNLDRFFRDNRSNEEYLYDILEGQMIEEFVVEWFIARGHSAQRIGSDANGKIVRQGRAQITTNPDLLVDGQKVEVQVSRQGKRNKYHIKKGKGDKILKGLNKLMFIVEDKYFMVDSSTIDKAPLIINRAWGGKETYEITNVNYLKLGGNYGY